MNLEILHFRSGKMASLFGKLPDSKQVINACSQDGSASVDVWVHQPEDHSTGAAAEISGSPG